MIKFLVTICARGGSKGIPKKNILKLGKHPLISYSIKSAYNFLKKKSGKITLSTDCDEIKLISKSYGLDTNYIRPKILSTDSVGKINVIYDILNYEESLINDRYDFVLDLDVSSPLRTENDLDNAFKLLDSNPNALNLFSVSPAKKNPYFNMVEKKNKYFFKVKNLNHFETRQSAPKVYELNASFYFYKRKFFDEKYKSVFTNQSLIYEVPHLCFDIDEKIDLDFMNFLLEKKKLNNIL